MTEGFSDSFHPPRNTAPQQPTVATIRVAPVPSPPLSSHLAFHSASLLFPLPLPLPPPRLVMRSLAVVVLAALLSSAGLLAVSGQSVPTVIFHTPQNQFTQRSYGGCAWNNTAILGHKQSNAFFQFGGQTVPCCNGFQSTLDFSNNPSFSFTYAGTFTATNFTYSNWGQFSGGNPTMRVAPVAAVLPNGNVVLGGGKAAPSWTL